MGMLLWVTKTCIHNVQFVQFLTSYLDIVIRFVELQRRSADRKPYFVADRIVRRVFPYIVTAPTELSDSIST